MHTTRSAHLRRMLGLAAVPALLLTAAACGDDDDSAGSEGSFCERAQALDERFADVDPTTDDAGEAIAAMTSLDPPDEIADDWALMLSAWEDMSGLDPTDPEAAAAFQERFADIGPAADRVETYMSEECGL